MMRGDPITAPLASGPFARMLPTVFGVPLCVGYVYVVFFFFFMSRTVFWPSYFAH
jgi:hypothetical protein